MINNLLVIPAPPESKIGFVYIYGIAMALGVFAATYIAHIRYSKKHQGSNAIFDGFIVVILCGIVGARLYHLFTGYSWDDDGIVGVFKIRNGGLSIWGAVIGGALGLYFYARSKNLSFLEMGDAITVGLCVGQFIGRFGNYFNQELFGKPLNSFWALEVDEKFRPLGYEAYKTFHPTFLYEGLLCLLIALVIIQLEKRKDWPTGASMAVYISLYCAVRCLMEILRIDDAQKIFGIRFNLLFSLVLCIGALTWLYKLLNQKVSNDT